MRDKDQDTKPIQRVLPDEPLAHYRHALFVAEATQRAITTLYHSAKDEGMEDLLPAIGQAWSASKELAERLRNMEPPPNITPPLGK